MKDAPSDILDSFDWLHAPGSGWGAGVWVSLLVVLALLAGGGWFFWRRRKLGHGSFAPPPHLAALRALEALRQKLTEENQLEFIVEVSQVVRDYIQARFGIRAPHRSTKEFLEEAYAGEPLLRDFRDELGSFLGQCDLVKFAQRRVVLAQMGELLESACRFVQATIPSEPAKISAA